MPTYEYECTSCGHRFTKFQNMTDKPLSKCPQCGGAVRRLISGGSGVIFKGTGFHSTDYPNRNPDSDSCCSRGETCSNPKRCCDN